VIGLVRPSFDRLRTALETTWCHLQSAAYGIVDALDARLFHLFERFTIDQFGSPKNPIDLGGLAQFVSDGHGIPVPGYYNWCSSNEVLLAPTSYYIACSGLNVASVGVIVNGCANAILFDFALAIGKVRSSRLLH
jgi:hypothetical protein